jgi:cell pole-organizing protein PopZ
MARDLNSIAKLIEDVSGSLHREIAEFRAEVNARFDDLEKSIKRHDAGILAANIAVNGITRAQARQEQQLRDLSARVRKLEQRKAK